MTPDLPIDIMNQDLVKANDILIGAADLYSWDQIKVWAKSIRGTGFTGDVALICYRLNDPDKVYEECKKLNIQIVLAEHDSDGESIRHHDRGRNTQSHQLRFFHAWQLLQEKQYRFVIMTDVRDVYFQTNPVAWLEKRYCNFIDTGTIDGSRSDKFIIAPTEAIRYQHESWGNDNLYRGFGPYIWEKLKHNVIYNVGTLAGTYKEMMNLCLLIYTMTQNRYIPSDQSAFNVILQTFNWYHVFFTETTSAWACQCGTMMDETKLDFFRPNLIGTMPEIINDVVMVEQPRKMEHDRLFKTFVIVHQYDRVPKLKEIIERRINEI